MESKPLDGDFTGSPLPSPSLTSQGKAHYDVDSTTKSSLIRIPSLDITESTELKLDGDMRPHHRRPSFGHKVKRNSSSAVNRFHTPADLFRLVTSHNRPYANAEVEDANDNMVSKHPNYGARRVKSKPNLNPTQQKTSRKYLTYQDLLHWIGTQKSRIKLPKSHRNLSQPQPDVHKSPDVPTTIEPDSLPKDHDGPDHSSRRASDASSNGSLALDNLREIIEHLALNEKYLPFSLRRNRRPVKPLATQHTHVTHQSELDLDDEPPTCNQVLDNSKTLSYAVPETIDLDFTSRPSLNRTVSTIERENWTVFQRKTLDIIHQLKIPSWSRVQSKAAPTISIVRLSGALTNAVYVVCPPKDAVSPPELDPSGNKKTRPKKLLLRIYGSQVEHLIDRNTELQILRRLGRKNIGPRLLGTFANGRFEEFLNAKALTAPELRMRDISRQIAKRMRELHQGVELLDEEVNNGPFVFQNISKWMQKAEKRVARLDRIVKARGPSPQKLSVWHNFVGTDFGTFKKAVEKYKIWLQFMYAGSDNLKKRLVFTHNDAQYGNILRLEPSQSPNLMAMNQHKRLVVIDFEYANANVPEQDIANHFTEWCYNYHDDKMPFACNIENYPKPDQQDDFLRAYLSHRPEYQAADTRGRKLSNSSLYSVASSFTNTPAMGPLPGDDPSSSPTDGRLPGPALTMKDIALSSSMTPRIRPLSKAVSSPQPQAHQAAASKNDEDESMKRIIAAMKDEIRAWRGINSAQWVLWGLVQAKIPDEEEEEEDGSSDGPNQPTTINDVEEDNTDEEARQGSETEGEEPADGFDYLKYAKHRAAFFWGDVLLHEIMHPEELPPALVQWAHETEIPM